MYSEKVIEHFQNPRNVGEIRDADGVATVGSPACGIFTMYVKVEGGKISDIRFKTWGCAAAIASGSVLTEMVKGKSVEDAKKISGEDVVRELGGLPELKLHCSLAVDTLRKALENATK